MVSSRVLSRLGDYFWSDPLMGIAIAAAIFALATTPIAFAVMGRLEWFQARRGRVYQKPSFAAVVSGMLLVMGIPAIFCALAIKSQYFDKNRYEFDPNHTWTVFDQGRGYETREDLERALRGEMERLASERKKMVESVKKLDEAMLVLRSAARQAPPVEPQLMTVLDRLASVRAAIGVDGPQQLIDLTAPPVDLPPRPVAPALATAPAAAPALSPASPGGFSKAEVDAELASVPPPQKTLAALLPLSDLPPGWTVGKDMGSEGHGHLETFNADNLFEKIDGRAESFIQYDVRGMAYTYYHPTGDDSGEVQLYIFEMGNSLKALGKYGSEKPDGVTAIPLGVEGYTTAGSTFFYAGPYYIQFVSNKDEEKYAAFALELAKRIAASLKPAPSVAGAGGATSEAATPESIFSLLPPGPQRSSPKYVSQDVFGYSFLSDVFMADYQESDKGWQGFLRPYPSPAEAKAVFEKYVDSAKQDGATVKMIEAEGADQMVETSNVGLIDVIFLKGNAVGGANGATDAARAEMFAKTFVKSLPASMPIIENQKQSAAEGTEDGAGPK